METPVLWQFTSSHFNEKARWALDFKRVPHIRRSLVPGFHFHTVKRISGQTSVPMLKLNGEIIHDSTRIIAAQERTYPEPPLYPLHQRRALELEEFFDEELGPYIRRWVFHLILPYPQFVRGSFVNHASLPTRLAHRVMAPLFVGAMKRQMDITPASAELARTKTVAAMDRLAKEVRPSGYLAGDHFTVADLTAAALLSPIVRPRNSHTKTARLSHPHTQKPASLCRRIPPSNGHSRCIGVTGVNPQRSPPMQKPRIKFRPPRPPLNAGSPGARRRDASDPRPAAPLRLATIASDLVDSLIRGWPLEPS